MEKYTDTAILDNTELNITYCIVSTPLIYEECHGHHVVEGGIGIELTSVEVTFNAGILAFTSLELLPLLTEEQKQEIIYQL